MNQSKSNRAHIRRNAAAGRSPNGAFVLALSATRQPYSLDAHLTGIAKISYPVLLQVHGFLAQASLLDAAAGRSPYGASAPAFSDTRPTYSRDAQDEEAPHSDISGTGSYLSQILAYMPVRLPSSLCREAKRREACGGAAAHCNDEH